MNHHDLKIYPEHYRNVRDGSKTFEIRNNDRAFQKGDSVSLYYWPRNAKQDESFLAYTSQSTPSLSFIIGDVYPIDYERVVFSLLKVIKEQLP